jgi:hypothetical protein
MCKKLNSLVAAILLACLMTFSNSSSAQSFSIGPRVGLNFATVTGDADSGFTKSMYSGLLIGAVANIGINDMFSIQPEVLFSQQGIKEKLDANDSLSIALRLNYITIPILAKVSFGTESAKGFINAGPYLGYLLGGTMTFDDKVDKDKKDLNSDDLNDMNRMDFGISLGAGGSINAGPGALQLDVRYNLGLTDRNKFDGPKPDNYQSAKNGVFSVSLAYLFKLGGE